MCFYELNTECVLYKTSSVIETLLCVFKVWLVCVFKVLNFELQYKQKSNIQTVQRETTLNIIHY